MSNDKRAQIGWFVLVAFLGFLFGFTGGQCVELPSQITGYVRYHYDDIFECELAKHKLARMETGAEIRAALAPKTEAGK